MVWYFHLFKNFPVCCDSHKGFSVVSEAEIDVFLKVPCFFYDTMDHISHSLSDLLHSV